MAIKVSHDFECCTNWVWVPCLWHCGWCCHCSPTQQACSRQCSLVGSPDICTMLSLLEVLSLRMDAISLRTRTAQEAPEAAPAPAGASS